MRTIGVVTVGRSDYGLYVPILRAIQREPTLRLRLLVSGMHLSEEFGLTVKEIEADGFPIGDRIDLPLSSDTPEAVAAAIGVGVAGFARAYATHRPDLLLILGDRFEMYAAAVAALPFAIPVAHIHGGELTQGAMDDALRHSMTKLSHLHFVATHVYARRVRQLGEEPWRVVVSGSPAVDHLRTLRLLPRRDLEAHLGLTLEPPPLLVTYHPVTLEYEQTEWQIQELLEALRPVDRPLVFTAPNADTRHRTIRRAIEQLIRTRPNAVLVDAMGTQRYVSLMALAAAMVGNSSSGIIEAPSFNLPAVNIGTRQHGRLRAENVIDVGYPREEIQRGLATALAPSFRAALRGGVNPYGEGHAAEIIVQQVKEIPLDARLIQKRFVDAPRASAPAPEREVAADVS